MKLELKHLAPYLPYGLKLLVELRGKFNNEPNSIVIKDWKMTDLDAPFKKRYRVISCKPLLIPLSELKNTNCFEDIARACENRMVEEYYHSRLDKGYSPLGMPYWVFTKLLEYHFDVFGLIENGLALNKLDFNLSNY